MPGRNFPNNFDLWINSLDRNEVTPISYQTPVSYKLFCVGRLSCKQHDWFEGHELERGSRWLQAELGLRKTGFSGAHFYPAPETAWSRLCGLRLMTTDRIAYSRGSRGMNMSTTSVHAFPSTALIADALAQVPPNHSRLVSVVPTLQVRKSSLSRE